MQILSLTLEDTKSYATANIRFAEGVNAIVGHNGAGKSTILEAIGFALFGMLDYNSAEFVREGAREANVVVEFISNYDERVYQVIRRCGKRNAHQVYDPEHGLKLCEGKADVITFLRQHLGVDPATDLEKLFRDAVGVPQGAFTASFLLNPAQRKGTFDPLLRVEEYRKAAENLVEPRRLLREQQQTLAVQLAEILGRLAHLPKLETEYAQGKEELIRVAHSLQQDATVLQQTRSRHSELEGVRQQVVAAEQGKTQGTQRLHSLQTQREMAGQALRQAENSQAIVLTYQADHDRYVAAQERQRQLAEQNKQRQALLSQRNEADKKLALARNDEAKAAGEMGEIAEAEALVAALAAAVARQDQIENTLQELRQSQKKAKELQLAVQQREQKLTQFFQQESTLRAKLAQADELLGQKPQLETAIQSCEQQIDESKSRMAEIKAEVDAIKAQNATLEKIEQAVCPVCEEALSETQRTRLIQRNEQRIVALRTPYGVAQSENKSLTAKLANLRTQLNQVQDQLLHLPRSSELSNLQQQIEAAQHDLAAFKQQQAELETIAPQIIGLEGELAGLGNPRRRSQVASAQIQRRSRIQSQLDQTHVEIRQQEERLHTLHSQLLAFEQLDAAAAEVNAVLSATLQGYQQVLSHRRLADSLEAQRAIVSRLEAQCQTATEELAALEVELAQLAQRFDPVEYQKIVTTEQELLQRVSALQTQKRLLEQEQTRRGHELDELRKEQENSALLRALQERLHHLEQNLEDMRQALRQAGPPITKALITQISHGAAQIFSDLMQDYSRQLQWNEDYSITLEVDGRTRQFAQLSGGEQMAAALAVRLGLLREMSNIDIAFFDEPTTNLDEVRRELLSRQILDVRGFRQLFVISHDDTFEQATQNVIRVARVDGLSQIVENE
jgi:exonuclease SbcC